MNGAARPIFGQGLLFLTSGHNTVLLAVKPGGQGDITSGTSCGRPTRECLPDRPCCCWEYCASWSMMVASLPAWMPKRGASRQDRLGDPFSGSPIHADGRIYCAMKKGTTHIIEAGRTFKKLAANQAGRRLHGLPGTVGKSLILRTKTHLYCIEQRLRPGVCQGYRKRHGLGPVRMVDHWTPPSHGDPSCRGYRKRFKPVRRFTPRHARPAPDPHPEPPCGR